MIICTELETEKCPFLSKNDSKPEKGHIINQTTRVEKNEGICPQQSKNERWKIIYL